MLALLFESKILLGDESIPIFNNVYAIAHANKYVQKMLAIHPRPFMDLHHPDVTNSDRWVNMVELWADRVRGKHNSAE